jgi:glutaredoxin
VTERAVVLLVAFAVGAALVAAYSLYRRRSRQGPDRLDVDDLDLELMEGCCAFVVFTTPTCRPCKAVLRTIDGVLGNGKAPAPTEVRTVDAAARHELAVRYEIRTVPTTFLITASGHVIDRWRDVPDPQALQSALDRL